MPKKKKKSKVRKKTSKKRRVVKKKSSKKRSVLKKNSSEVVFKTKQELMRCVKFTVQHKYTEGWKKLI